MKTRYTLILFFVAISQLAFGQDDYQIKTLFTTGRHASGGYGALGNKFTRIHGEFANMAEVYGGWYINHKFLLGVEGAAVTNNIRVPQEYSTIPDVDMSYEYGQFGLMTEYTLWSHRAIHFSFHMMNGAGFTVQYNRHKYDDSFDWDYDYDHPKDENWFFVSEPGVKLEMNVFKWMRFSPGVSYRGVFGSQAPGLSDKDLSGISYNATLKFGRF